MKRLICAVLVTVFFISSIPAFTLAAGSEAQTVQFRTVWENPYTLTTYHPDNEVNSTFYTFPQVIWNGSQYVNYILNSSDMSAGIGSVYIKVCPDHTVFYDPHQKEEEIESESWNVECYNTSSLEWETDCPISNSVCYLVNSSGIYFDRTTILRSGATLDEQYWLRIGSELKISVTLHPVQATEYSLIWQLGGVSGTKARWLTTTQNITAQLVNDPSCSSVQFASGNESKSLVDWSDAFIFNESTEKYTTCFQQLEFQKGVSDGQCQARISFGDFMLAPEEPLTLDPYVATFNSTGASSGFIEQYGLSYPPPLPNGGTLVDTGDSLYVGQNYNQGNGGYMIDRSYLSFDTSSIPAMAYNMSATLQLEAGLLSSLVNFTVQVWGGNQPVCSGNLTIMDGTQPIYNDDLNADSWGSGRVQVAAWNTANYQSGVYVNLTIPPNQINKVDSTEFELNSSREGTPPGGDEFVQFYGDNSTGNGPELEVSYCLDTVTINGETWFYRNASTSKVVIVLFGAYWYEDHLEIRSIDWLGDLSYNDRPEKDIGKIMFIDALIASGFSVYTPSCSSINPVDAPSQAIGYVSNYKSDSTWVQDLTMDLMYNASYTQVYLFGFSGGGIVVGNEIQKDYAFRFSAAVMNCAVVDWSIATGQIYHTAGTSSKARVATSFVENVNDTLSTLPPTIVYNQMLSYWGNETVQKEWHDWMGGHGDFFTPNCTCLDPPYENDSVAVIGWFNAYHPPNTPFIATGSQTIVANTGYSYSSGTVDPNGQNVSYQFNWGDGTSNTTGYYPSGTNVTCTHAWSNQGSYNITVLAQDSQNSSFWSPPLTVNVYSASITGCNVYYSDASQNLTTFDMDAQQDYNVTVNFTWHAARTYDVSLLVAVLNPNGVWAWYSYPGVYFDVLDPNNYTEPLQIMKWIPSAGTGTLMITLTSNSSYCAVPWNEAVKIVSSNNPPNSPSFTYGTWSGYNGTIYNYGANATDPDGDNIQYVFNWGDGTANTTTAWSASGVQGTAHHKWTSPGTYNITVYVYDPYRACSSNTTTVTMTQRGGGCPYVYDWNGSAYVKDNNILPASENGNGTDTKDYYLLQQPLVPVFSTKQKSVYSLQIGEFENDTDYIDQAQLIAVDHSQGTGIAVTQQGQIIAYKNLASPITCIDNNDNSELAEISSMNGNVSDPSTYYQGNKGDWLLLDFGTVTGPHANLILRDDMKCIADNCIDVQVPNATGGWQTIDVLNPRDFWSMEAVNMTAYLPANGDFIVRLLWTQTHRLDYVGLDTSPPAPVQVSSAPPTLAIHSTLGNVTSKLLYDDEQCVELVNGQQITIWFTLPSQAKGTTRSFILYTDGYYYTITP